MVAHRQSTSAADPERAYNERSAPDWPATHTSHPMPCQCRDPRRRLSEKDRRVTWVLLISFLSSSSSFLRNPVQQIAMDLFSTCVFIGLTPTSVIFLRVRAWARENLEFPGDGSERRQFSKLFLPASPPRPLSLTFDCPRRTIRNFPIAGKSGSLPRGEGFGEGFRL